MITCGVQMEDVSGVDVVSCVDIKVVVRSPRHV